MERTVLSRSRPLACTPLDAPFAAEINGFDVRGLDGNEGVEVVLDQLFRHQVLVFRNQALTPAELVAFVRLFGEPQFHVLDQYLLPEQREIYVLSNITRDGKPIGNPNEGITWHTDLSSRERPTAYTILYSLEVPKEGGHTRFASTYLAYEALSADDQARYRKMRGVHSYKRQYEARRAMLAAKGDAEAYGDLRTDQERAATRSIHPLVHTHPVTGRKGLYLATLSLEGFAGMGEADGIALGEKLVDYVTSEPFRYEHHWRVGDLVMWDNRGLMHVAGPYDKERERRLVYRLSIEGERPF